MKVGQKVYLYGGFRFGKELTETVITEIGRKYFKVESPPERFYIDTLQHDGGQYISRYRAFLSKQDFDDYIEHGQLANKLRSKQFDSLSLEQLRQIHKIINNE
jgi:hypothetical protein